MTYEWVIGLQAKEFLRNIKWQTGKHNIDHPNAEFSGDIRKLVFWYDDKGEFAGDMQTAELEKSCYSRI